MREISLSKTYSPPPLHPGEVLRYAGCREANSDTEALLEECLQEVMDKLTYRVCYCQSEVLVDGDQCQLGPMVTSSRNLAELLKGCNQALIFAATVGVEIDRLISRYSRVSPAKALMFQAIGAERIESLCDVFCRDVSNQLEENLVLTPRFSPGYGDLSLDLQREIFSLLQCHRTIGLTLNDSLLMSPTKSVTAIMGIRSAN